MFSALGKPQKKVIFLMAGQLREELFFAASLAPLKLSASVGLSYIDVGRPCFLCASKSIKIHASMCNRTTGQSMPIPRSYIIIPFLGKF